MSEALQSHRVAQAWAVPEPLQPRERGAGLQRGLTDWSRRTLRALQGAARHKGLVCLAMALLPMGMRLAALRAIPFPQPLIHDEFSYLLAADTFRSGRLTNPPHPMWQHFETFHEIMQPTYQSKYPPAQGLVMALGWKLFGHPWYGVWISFGVMCACLCWMLQGWMPPLYALLGTIAAIGQIGIFDYWMDSYWGGAVAAAGGSLVLGALPRLARRPSAAAAALGAFGVVILANSRPYEGAVMVAGAAAGLLWWRSRRGRPLRELLSWRIVAPLLVIGVFGVAWMGYYNYRVTGTPWKMPYTVYQENYSLVTQWLILPPNPHPPAFRHEILRKYMTDVEVAEHIKSRHNPLRPVMKQLFDALSFYFSTLVFFAAAAALIVGRSVKLLLAAGIGALLNAAVLVESWHQAHYLACGAGLVFVIAMYGVRMLRPTARRFAPALMLLFVAIPFVTGGLRAISEFRLNELTTTRDKVAQKLLPATGKQLVIVRYDLNHDTHGDWVFNAADIDASRIVWARDMGAAKNRELVEYYHDRKAWILHGDPPFTLTPYPGDAR